MKDNTQYEPCKTALIQTIHYFSVGMLPKYIYGKRSLPYIYFDVTGHQFAPIAMSLLAITLTHQLLAVYARYNYYY
jgi:hypothetical protein